MHAKDVRENEIRVGENGSTLFDGEFNMEYAADLIADVETGLRELLREIGAQTLSLCPSSGAGMPASHLTAFACTPLA